MPRELVQELESVAQQKDVSLNQLVTNAANTRLTIWIPMKPEESFYGADHRTSDAAPLP